MARVTRMISMRKLLSGVIVIFAMQLASCGGDKPQPVMASNAAPQPAATATSPVRHTPAAAEPELVVSGPIIVEHEVDLTAQRDGVVTQIFYDVPAHVKAGTLLAQFDDRQLQAQLESARAKSRSVEADLNNWKAERKVMQADYTRAQQAAAQGLISAEQLQHAQFQVESHDWDIKRVTELLNNAQNDERSLEMELQKTTIVVPFDAVVARRYIRESQSVAKGDRLFWVTSEAPLLVRFTLPEGLFGKVHRAQEFRVDSPDAAGELHTARVREISPVVDPASGTFEVLVELTGNPGSLRPGMSASVHLAQLR